MGNYSKDPQEVLDDALEKGYSRVRFQQGKPLIDRELNLLGDLASPQRIAKHHLGNGVPEGSDGFRISGVTPINFTIGAGRCLVNGYEIVLGEDTTYKTQPHNENAGPIPLNPNNVYLRVFTSEVNKDQDGELGNENDVGFETSVREKVEWEVLVTSDVIDTPDHFSLAVINGLTSTAEDQRRTELTFSTIRDEIKRARGETNSLSERLDVSLTPDGTLNDNTVGSNQIQDNAISGQQIVDGGVGTDELADNAVTREKLGHLAVGKSQIEAGSVSIAQLDKSVVFDGEVSVLAKGSEEVGLGGAFIGAVHRFYLISVLYLSPVPPPFTTSRSVNWRQKNRRLNLPGPGRLLQWQHILVLENPHNFDITVSCKVYSISEI